VCLAILGCGDRALSASGTVEALCNLVGYVGKRRLPATEELELDDEEGVRRRLDSMVGSELLLRHEEGLEVVHRIAQLALLRAAEGHVADPPLEFWEEALRLRDLLKFEFFFEEKKVFRGEIRRELALHVPEWERELERGPDAITAILPRLRPFHAHRILLPFLETYRVVGDLLKRQDPGKPVDEAAFVRDGLALGRQYVLQRHIVQAESVFKVLFGTALKLARNRGLLEPGGPECAEGRRAFASEIRGAKGRTAASRRDAPDDHEHRGAATRARAVRSYSFPRSLRPRGRK